VTEDHLEIVDIGKPECAPMRVRVVERTPGPWHGARYLPSSVPSTETAKQRWARPVGERRAGGAAPCDGRLGRGSFCCGRPGRTRGRRSSPPGRARSYRPPSSLSRRSTSRSSRSQTRTPSRSMLTTSPPVHSHWPTPWRGRQQEVRNKPAANADDGAADRRGRRGALAFDARERNGAGPRVERLPREPRRRRYSKIRALHIDKYKFKTS
jgi:hypothetical protein